VVDVTDRKRSEQSLRNALAEVQQLRLKLEADNVYLREELSQTYPYSSIVGKSEEIGKVLEEVDRVAPTEMTVLILGETGTGKELVARALHAQGGRNERPLVKVNCSALPAELIESELFGHEKGAFTGAVARQVGRFELADGGTIFLDEIGELPLRLQPKLLRVLQEGEFERLGSAKTIKVDVRVIAATNRNLAEAVKDGRFRADLYYRLNVYPIEIPPLRERRDDIGLLAEVFLRESERRLGNRYGKIPAEVMEDLREYSWPGNVRELENVIARAAVTSNGSTLQLPAGWNHEGNPGSRNGELKSYDPDHAHPVSGNANSAATLLEFKKAHIVDVLRQTNWRIEGPKGAALILGVHPNTLRSRLSKFGIQKPSNPRKPVAETTK
jgi:transcriptional regulator with GAF, ATPase, and Fis domain